MRLSSFLMLPLLRPHRGLHLENLVFVDCRDAGVTRKMDTNR